MLTCTRGEKFISNRSRNRHERIVGVNHTKTFRIQSGNSNRLDRYYKEYKQEQRRHGRTTNLSACANDLLKEILDLKQLQANLDPSFSINGEVDKKGRLHVCDDETGEHYLVIRQYDKLRCLRDDSTNCSHAIFARTQPKAIGLFATENFEEMSTIRTGPNRSSSMIEGNGET